MGRRVARGGGGRVALSIAGTLVAAWLARRAVRGWRAWHAARRALERVEERVVRALAEDPLLHDRPIEVAAVADGIVELSGAVRTDDEVRRAAAVARKVPGVRTVLVRLDAEILAEHLAETRRRLEEGAPALEETHWYGLGTVGTGRRRQARRTEPDRPDERVPILTRSFGAARAVEETSEVLEKLPPGVEGHTTVPAAPSDRGTVDRAPHRRLGNVPPVPLQALNPASRLHENVKKAEGLTLEESGLAVPPEEH